MPEGFQTDADDAILRNVLAVAKQTKGADVDAAGELTPAFASYITQLVRFATGDDKIWDDPQSLLSRCLSAWKAAEQLPPGGNVIELRVEKAADWRQSRLVLDIITEDKPFLVDSITAALVDAGKPVSFFVNAVVDVARDARGKRSGGKPKRESMIRAEMDPPIDDDEMPRLRAELERVLADVSISVADWEAMRARLGACIAQIERARPEGVAREDLRETVEFLKWLWDNRFAFLGVRRYAFEASGGAHRFEHDPASDLGILKDPSRRILKQTHSADGHLSPSVEAFLRSGEPILVAKANAKSIVHRRVYMDYVGVKTFGPDGKVDGEERFVGLFTADAYNRPASDIPLIRAKLRQVVESAGFPPGGHNEKALANILETFPRDEIFQTDLPHLRDTALGILRLYKRPRVKLFLRRDRFERFVSAIVFVPRERFASEVREAIGNVLARAYDGRVSAFYPYFGEATLVRVHYIIGLDPGAPEGPSVTELTQQLRTLCRDWRDDLLEAMRSGNEGVAPRGLFSKYEKAFDAAYLEYNGAADALQDIEVIEGMGGRSFALRVSRKAGDPPHILSIRLYRRGGPMRLSAIMPTIENLGLSVDQEGGYDVRPSGSDTIWIHDFRTEERAKRAIDVAAAKKNLEEALTAILEGRCEDDGFNALVVAAGVNWREAWLLRAMAKYHQQAGVSPSLPYIAETLSKHAAIAAEIVGVFHARFNPAGAKAADKREAECAVAEKALLKSLESVESLDEDRILRRFLNLLTAMTRTNYFQRDAKNAYKTYISFKLDSANVEGLPKPTPYREIFVSGPRVDGVHLRFGPVARGGLRWSDRREDFRTEVLGLVKAQKVKNAVIVPTGSKGGFYPKQLPASGDRAAVFEEGREAYKIFVRGLLDLTDNIVGGSVKQPPNMVIWDGQDPYLVVAADKGTATFSDTANGISAEYGFWLGDAFASGGSVGYDHKVMGITARGAWEAVKRHFREMGKDIQTEPFTVAGIGDMSGDVFGNGMLLSEQIRLVAAFDHRDIFIDPDPDAAISFAERRRMFALPRSSWADYDAKLISKGGGVFSRAAKSISVTPEMKALLGIAADKATPAELMRAILKADVELFWLGGIGTYVKASTEENLRVGDRANDALRIDATEMRAKVVGEGANLGFTQLGRVEFARRGGRINTDAIDNSAGVDSSDHEVNIKILLAAAIEHGELKAEARNDLLRSMTDDVGTHVLRHNFDQTRALSLMQSSAAADLDAHARMIAAFEAEGRLDRAIEYLPSTEEIAALRARGQGLTRPELAVLLAYCKLWLFEKLVASTAPDDPLLEGELFDYFPEALIQYKDVMVRHRLRREIIATRMANEIADTCGASYPHRVIEATGADPAQVALAYEAARRILSLGAFAAAVDALDAKAPAALQTALYNEASDLIRDQLDRIVNDAEAATLLEKRGLKAVIDQYAAPIAAFKSALPDILPPVAAKAFQDRLEKWRRDGAPEALAREAALMPALERAFDIVNLSRKTGWSSESAGAVYFALGRALELDRVREARTVFADHFDTVAADRIFEDLAVRQSGIAARVIAFAKKEPKGPPSEWLEDLLRRWREAADHALASYDRFAGDLDLSGALSVGKLALLNKKLADLAERLA